MGIILGLVMAWVGIIVVLASRPMAKGEVRSREYNYRPWQPKFVKAITDEEADEINVRFAGYAVNSGILLSICGVLGLLLGIVGYGFWALVFIAVPILVIIGLSIGAYVSTYQVSKQKLANKRP